MTADHDVRTILKGYFAMAVYPIFTSFASFGEAGMHFFN